MPYVVAFAGKAGTGKTSMSRELASMLEAPVLSFGDVVRQEAAKKYGYPMEWTRTRKLHVLKNGMTVRETLQECGAALRKVDSLYVVKSVRKVLEETHEPFVLIDDVRMPDELEMIRAFPHVVVRMEPSAVWKPIAGNDVTETALDNENGWDMVLTLPLPREDGSFESLRPLALAVLDKVDSAVRPRL